MPLQAANVLLSSSDVDRRGFVAKVSDFGLSRVLAGNRKEIKTQTFGTVGLTGCRPIGRCAPGSSLPGHIARDTSLCAATEGLEWTAHTPVAWQPLQESCAAGQGLARRRACGPSTSAHVVVGGSLQEFCPELDG